MWVESLMQQVTQQVPPALFGRSNYAWIFFAAKFPPWRMVEDLVHSRHGPWACMIISLMETDMSLSGTCSEYVSCRTSSPQIESGWPLLKRWMCWKFGRLICLDKVDKDNRNTTTGSQWTISSNVLAKWDLSDVAMETFTLNVVVCLGFLWREYLNKTWIQVTRMRSSQNLPSHSLAHRRPCTHAHAHTHTRTHAHTYTSSHKNGLTNTHFWAHVLSWLNDTSNKQWYPPTKLIAFVKTVNGSSFKNTDICGWCWSLVSLFSFSILIFCFHSTVTEAKNLPSTHPAAVQQWNFQTYLWPSHSASGASSQNYRNPRIDRWIIGKAHHPVRMKPDGEMANTSRLFAGSDRRYETCSDNARAARICELVHNWAFRVAFLWYYQLLRCLSFHQPMLSDWNWWLSMNAASCMSKCVCFPQCGTQHNHSSASRFSSILSQRQLRRKLHFGPFWRQQQMVLAGPIAALTSGCLSDLSLSPAMFPCSVSLFLLTRDEINFHMRNFLGRVYQEKILGRVADVIGFGEWVMQCRGMAAVHHTHNNPLRCWKSRLLSEFYCATWLW